MMQLPQHSRDPGFQRRIERLERCEQVSGRDSAQWRLELDEPWVTDHPYREGVETHCMHGHVNDHKAFWPPELHHGAGHVRRRCVTCSSTWLEPVQP